MDKDERIVIGRVVRPHGLTGEVSVEILTDFPERFVPGLNVELRSADGGVRPGRLASARPHGGRMLIRFEGIDEPNGAESLRGLDLCVSPGQAPPRPPGFVFHWEVAGCQAVDASGAVLGIVRELIEVGGRSLLVVDTPRGPRDVPFSHPIVSSVDIAAKRIVLDAPAGLLD